MDPEKEEVGMEQERELVGSGSKGYARYTKRQLAHAMKEHCFDCNDTTRFKGDTDCLVERCKLFPFRPGDGPGHAPSKPKSTRKSSGEGLRKYREAQKGRDSLQKDMPALLPAQCRIKGKRTKRGE